MSNYPNWQSYSYKHSFIESFPISFYNENKNQCEDSIKMKLFDKVKDYIFDGKNYKIRCELATNQHLNFNLDIIGIKGTITIWNC